MFYYSDFIKPLSNGHLHELNKIDALDPGAAQSLIRAKEFFAFRDAAERGHLHVLDRLIELLPKNEIPNMLHKNNFSIFSRAASNGHLHVLDRLIELLPKNEIPNMLRAYNFSVFYGVFYGAASNGHLHVLDRLIELLPKNEIPNMLHANDFPIFSRAASNGRINILGLLPENKILNMIDTFNIDTFYSAASNGHLNILDRLIELLPENKIPNILHENDFSIFSRAASNGHLNILDRLIELLPKNEIPNMLRAHYFSVFYGAASNGHLHVLDRLLGLLPENEIPNMLRANDFYIFFQVASYGHFSILDRLLGLLPENEIPNMLHAKDFYIFCQAASNGHLKILDRLIELLPRNEIQNMLHAKDFYIFCQAASNGHLKILDRLIELLPENEIPNKLRANDFAIFCQVASNNQIKILDRLLGLLPENEIPNMLRAYNFSVFHSVAEHGHLSILDRFLGLLPENEIPNMLSSHFFCVFRRANENGHLSILERLIRLLPENEIPHMFRAQTLFLSAAETEEDLFYILEGLMTFPSIFDFAEREIGLEIHVKDFINLTLIFLRIEIEAHQINNPTIVFDVLDSDKAQLYSYILRNLIRQNKSQNFEAVALLLQIPSVHLLASENNFYLSEQSDFYKQLPKNELISFFKSLPSSINSLIIDENKYTPPACYLLSFSESKIQTLYQDYVFPLDNENDELLTFKAIEPLIPMDKKTFIEMIELFEQHPTPQSDIACALLLEGRIINEILVEKPHLQDTNKSHVLQTFDSFNQCINIGLEISYTILTRNDVEFFSALAQYVETHMNPIMDSATRCRLYALDFLRRAACNAAQEIAKTIEAIASHIKATEPVDSPIFQKLSLLSFSQEQGFLESTQPNPSFIIDSNMLPEIDINSLRKLCDCVSGYKHGLFSQAKVSVMNEENNANNDHGSTSATR